MCLCFIGFWSPCYLLIFLAAHPQQLRSLSWLVLMAEVLPVFPCALLYPRFAATHVFPSFYNFPVNSRCQIFQYFLHSALFKQYFKDGDSFGNQCLVLSQLKIQILTFLSLVSIWLPFFFFFHVHPLMLCVSYGYSPTCPLILTPSLNIQCSCNELNGPVWVLFLVFFQPNSLEISVDFSPSWNELR